MKFLRDLATLTAELQAFIYGTWNWQPLISVCPSLAMLDTPVTIKPLKLSSNCQDSARMEDCLGTLCSAGMALVLFGTLVSEGTLSDLRKKLLKIPVANDKLAL